MLYRRLFWTGSLKLGLPFHQPLHCSSSDYECFSGKLNNLALPLTLILLVSIVKFIITLRHVNCKFKCSGKQLLFLDNPSLPPRRCPIHSRACGHPERGTVLARGHLWQQDTRVSSPTWRWATYLQKVTLTFPGFRYIKIEMIIPTVPTLLNYCEVDLSYTNQSQYS